MIGSSSDSTANTLSTRGEKKWCCSGVLQQDYTYVHKLNYVHKLKSMLTFGFTWDTNPSHLCLSHPDSLTSSLSCSFLRTHTHIPFTQGKARLDTDLVLFSGLESLIHSLFWNWDLDKMTYREWNWGYYCQIWGNKILRITSYSQVIQALDTW